jgi:hypothetical protein
MKIRVLILVFLILHSRPSQAQEEVDTESWWGFMTSGQIAPKWSLWLDTHHVPQLFVIFRSGLTYHAYEKKIALTAGYGYLRLPTVYSEGSLVRPEHRPWGQVVYRLPSSGPLSASFRFRYDMRFKQNVNLTELTNGYTLNNRYRFNMSLRYNWGNKLSPHFNFSNTLFNESLITTGPGPVPLPFEHRVFFLFGFQKKAVTISPGYHVRFATSNFDFLKINHGFVLWVNWNYNFKNSKKHNLKEFPSDKI